MTFQHDLTPDHLRPRNPNQADQIIESLARERDLSGCYACHRRALYRGYLPRAGGSARDGDKSREVGACRHHRTGLRNL